MEEIKKIKGILSDIDGTLYFKGKPIPGTIDTIFKLKNQGIKFLFFTNTDSKPPKRVLRILQSFGFPIKEDEIFTPIIALKQFLFKNPNKKVFFVTTKEVANEFQDITKVNESEIPDFVIIADFHDDWDVHRLNLAFKYVLKGSQLLGSQGNKFFLDKEGEPVIDTGSFVQMIANAADVKPRIFGKPSKEYFLQALERINLEKDEVLVIGDDLDSDIQGAINAGMKGILVKTGKGQLYDLNKSEIKPYKILDSFSSLIGLI